ncbi:MAG TPA: hypothetical protein VGM06_11410 [Polyangiaceae bacterium]|jgi:hypothetical protein
MKQRRSSRWSGGRAGERGASLVEAVVVVPVFIVLFAGALFLHHTLAKTQQTMLAARYQAWNSAMNDCAPNGGAAPQPELTSDMGGAPGSDVSLLANMGDATGTSNDSANVAILASGPAPVAQAGALDFHADIHSQAVVTCNATTEGGDLGGVIKWFYHSVGISTFWGMLFGQIH